MTEDQIRGLLREMRDEPVPPDSQARVRLAVAERVRSWPERLRRHWKIAAAILAPACVVLIAMLARQPAQRSQAVSPLVIQKSETPADLAPEFPPPQVALAPRRVVRAVRRPASPRYSDREDAGTVVRIETADPDVVILLVGG